MAATAVFWGLRLLVSASPAPSYAVAVGDASAVRADLSRVLGSAPVAVAANAAPAPEVSARFKLLGIMAPKGTSSEAKDAGVALIAVDGKPPKAFIVGSRLDEGLVLQSVSLRTASLGPAQGAASVKLELPAVPAAATGTLPAVSNSNNSANNPTPSTGAMPVPPRPGFSAPPIQPGAMVPPAFVPPAVTPIPGQPPQPQAQVEQAQGAPVVTPPMPRPDSTAATK